MDLIFLDANVLFSAAWREDARVRRLWELPEVEIITSTYAAEEARRNLKTPEQRSDFEKLLGFVRVIPVAPVGRPSPEAAQLPEGDRPILLAAIGAKATHLLTGDSTHFGRFYGNRIEGVLILPPGDYLREHAP